MNKIPLQEHDFLLFVKKVSIPLSNELKLCFVSELLMEFFSLVGEGSGSPSSQLMWWPGLARLNLISKTLNQF